MGGPGGEVSGLAVVELDHLLREVLFRVEGALEEKDRLRLLLDAVVTIGADLSLDGVLTRIVEIAGELVDAQYSALGVLGAGSGRRLRTFVHHGIDQATAVQVGELPNGHGLLGLIIDRPEPLRLHDLTTHPASYGVPPHHPTMTSFLGVPVRIRDQVFGNLYLTQKRGEADFTADDENIVVALAAAAGVAIENARLYEEASRRQRWLAGIAEVSRTLAGSSADGEAEGAGAGDLEFVVEVALTAAEAEGAWVVAGTDPGGSGDLALLARAGDLGRGEDDESWVLRPELCADVVAAGVARQLEDVAGVAGTVVVVPLGRASQVQGVLGLTWTATYNELSRATDLVQVAQFAEQSMVALQVARSREDRARLALLEDRDRIGRDLHDLVVQRLFAVGLSLSSLARQPLTGAQVARVDQAVDDIDDTIKDIRRSIFALGAMETAHDLQTEVARLVDRAAVTLKFRPLLRLSGPIETLVGVELGSDLLAVLAEGLSNASRHAEARGVEVELAAGDALVLTIRDDGRGMPSQVAESGLGNMRRRAEQRGGTLEIASGPQDGTTLTWCVPLRGATASD